MTTLLTDHGLLRAWRAESTETEFAQLYGRMHEEGPLIALPWGAVLVTSHAACRDVLADPVTWRNPDAQDFQRLCGPGAGKPARHGVNRTLFHLNGPDHAAQRRRFASFFTPLAMEAHSATIRNIVSGAVAGFVDRVTRTGSGDAVADLVAPAAGRVMCTLLGVSEQDHGFITRMASDLSFVEELAPRPSCVKQADAAIIELLAYGKRLIHDRTFTPEGGLIAYLLSQAGSSSRNTVDDVVTALVLMMTAGVSTSMALMSSAVLALGGDDDARHEAGAFVAECLRCDPPAHMVGRIAALDTVLAGQQVARGTLAHVMIGAANRDPAVFAQPHVFSPGRPQSRSLTFGAGPHYCLGAGLARLSAVHLVTAWRQWATGLAITKSRHRRRSGPNFRHLLSLPVTVISR